MPLSLPLEMRQHDTAKLIKKEKVKIYYKKYLPPHPKQTPETRAGPQYWGTVTTHSHDSPTPLSLHKSRPTG